MREKERNIITHCRPNFHDPRQDNESFFFQKKTKYGRPVHFHAGYTTVFSLFKHSTLAPSLSHCTSFVVGLTRTLRAKYQIVF